MRLLLEAAMATKLMLGVWVQEEESKLENVLRPPLHAFIKLGWGRVRGTWLLRSLSWNPKEKQKQACEAERQYRRQYKQLSDPVGTNTAVVERPSQNGSSGVHTSKWTHVRAKGERCSVLNKQQAPREEGRSLEIHGKDSCRKWRLGIRSSIYNPTLTRLSLGPLDFKASLDWRGKPRLKIKRGQNMLVSAGTFAEHTKGSGLGPQHMGVKMKNSNIRILRNETRLRHDS